MLASKQNDVVLSFCALKSVRRELTVAFFVFFVSLSFSGALRKRKVEERFYTTPSNPSQAQPCIMAFRWSQNASTVTITFPVAPSVKKSDIEVSVVNTILRAGVKGSVPLCEGTLTSPVKSFKWSLKAGIVSIVLEKGLKVKWNDLLVCFSLCDFFIRITALTLSPLLLTFTSLAYPYREKVKVLSSQFSAQFRFSASLALYHHFSCLLFTFSLLISSFPHVRCTSHF